MEGLECLTLRSWNFKLTSILEVVEFLIVTQVKESLRSARYVLLNLNPIGFLGGPERSQNLFPMLWDTEHEWWGPDQNQVNPCWIWDLLNSYRGYWILPILHVLESSFIPLSWVK